MIGRSTALFAKLALLAAIPMVARAQASPPPPDGWMADYFSASMAAVTVITAIATLWWTGREKAAALRRQEQEALERAEQRKVEAEKEAARIKRETEREAQQDRVADVGLMRTQVEWMIGEMRKDLANVREQLVDANKKLEQCEMHREEDWKAIVGLRDELDALRRKVSHGGVVT